MLASAFFPKDLPSTNPDSLAISAEAAVALNPCLELKDLGPPLTAIKLFRATQSLKKKKAPGIDGITAEQILLFFSYIEAHLHQIFEACLRQSYFPSGWKVARDITIPKPGKGDYSVASSPRPISLLGKLSEKIFFRGCNTEQATTAVKV